MDYIFAIAGIPGQVFDEVVKKISYIAPGKCTVIRRPQYKTTYSQADVDYYTKQFAQVISNDHDNKLHQTKFALIYIDYENAETQQFINAFTPYILPARVGWQADLENTKTKVAESKNQLIDILKSTIVEVKIALNLLRKEVVEKANRTPFLLPLKNFSSDVLQTRINHLHQNIVAIGNKEALIAQTIRTILANHPPQASNGNKPCFVDNKSIYFNSPGKSLHGFSRVDTGHPDICYISANVRLGARYSKAFHYDCTKGGKQQALTGSFFGCHQVGSSIKTGKPHLNISPNDHIR